MLLISLFFAFSQGFGSDFTIVSRGEVEMKKPAFITGSGQSLVISTFKLFGRDSIFVIPNDIETLRARPKPTLLTDEIVWPNEVLPVEKNVLGSEGYLVSSGFLMPGKSTGAVSFLERSSGRITQLTAPKKGYFYHRSVLVDIEGHGRVDILTARGHISAGQHDGELVWLQRPSHPLTEKWQERVLAKGPDIHFRVFIEPVTKILFVIAAEFSNKRLTLLWIEANGATGLKIIDSNLGNPFDLELSDLNHDGKPDLLVTNHQSDSTASVFAYEIPLDLKNGVWKRHTLLSQIKTLQKGFNQASPGIAKAFYPVVNKMNSKPWILVSGDGSQHLHLLIPKTEDILNWNYKEEIILDAKATVGEPMIYDFDGDGLADFVVPAYDTDKLYFLSLKPRLN